MIEINKNRKKLMRFAGLIITNLLFIVLAYFSYQDFKAGEQTFKAGQKVRAVVIQKIPGRGTIKDPNRVLFYHQNQPVELSIGRNLFRKLMVNQEIELYYNFDLKLYLPPDYNSKSTQNTFLIIWVLVPLFVLFSTIYMGIKTFLPKNIP